MERERFIESTCNSRMQTCGGKFDVRDFNSAIAVARARASLSANRIITLSCDLSVVSVFIEQSPEVVEGDAVAKD